MEHLQLNKDAKELRAMSLQRFEADDIGKALLLARAYLEASEDVNPLQDTEDALMVVMGERSKILDLHQKPDMGYIEELMPKLLAKYKKSYAEGEERNAHYDAIARGAVLLHAEALIEYGRCEEAIKMLMEEPMTGFWAGFKLFNMRKQLEAETFEEALITLWKQAADTNFSPEYREEVMAGVKLTIRRLKLSKREMFQKIISRGQSEGCLNAEKYAEGIWR